MDPESTIDPETGNEGDSKKAKKEKKRTGERSESRRDKKEKKQKDSSVDREERRKRRKERMKIEGEETKDNEASSSHDIRFRPSNVNELSQRKSSMPVLTREPSIRWGDWESQMKEMQEALDGTRKENLKLVGASQMAQATLLEQQSVIDRTKDMIQSSETKAQLAMLEASAEREKSTLLQNSIDEMQILRAKESEAVKDATNHISYENSELLERIRVLESVDEHDRHERKGRSIKLDKAKVEVEEMSAELERLRRTEQILSRETDDFRQGKLDAAVEVQGLTTLGHHLESHVHVLESGLHKLADRCRVLETEKNEIVDAYEELLARNQREKDEWAQSSMEIEEKLQLSKLSEKEVCVNYNKILTDEAFEWNRQLSESLGEMATAIAAHDTIEEKLFHISNAHSDLKQQSECQERAAAELESVLQQTERTVDNLTVENIAAKEEVDKLAAELKKAWELHRQAESAAEEAEIKYLKVEEMEQKRAKEGCSDHVLPTLWGKRFDELPDGTIKFLTEGYLPAQLPPLNVWPSAPVPPIPEDWRMGAIEEAAALKHSLGVALTEHAEMSQKLEDARVQRVKAEVAEHKCQQEALDWKRRYETSRRLAISAQRESDTLMRYFEMLGGNRGALPMCGPEISRSFKRCGQEISRSQDSFLESEDIVGDLISDRFEYQEASHTTLPSERSEDFSPPSSKKNKRGVQTRLQSHKAMSKSQSTSNESEKIKRPESQIVSSSPNMRAPNTTSRISRRDPYIPPRGNATEIEMRNADVLGDTLVGLNATGWAETPATLHCPAPSQRSFQSLIMHRA